MSFKALGLSEPVLRGVDACGYTDPTPIQLRAVPAVLTRRDLIASAQTGTGKTAAFVLPILDRLRGHANTSFSPARHPVRALIVVPTRELALQVHESVITYGRTVPLRPAVVYGGVPLDPGEAGPGGDGQGLTVAGELGFGGLHRRPVRAARRSRHVRARVRRRRPGARPTAGSVSKSSLRRPRTCRWSG